MSDLVEELKDDIKQEKYAKLWKDYGKYVILSAVLFVFSTAGFVWKEAYDVSTWEAKGDKVYAANEFYHKGDYKQAESIFSFFEEKENDVYYAIASLREASILQEEGKFSEANELYEIIASNKVIPVEMKELAHIIHIYNSYNLGKNSGDDEKLQKESIENLLELAKELANNGSVFSYSAKELLAFVNIEQGNYGEAIKISQDLLSDLNTPYGIKNKAREILNMIPTEYVMDNIGEEVNVKKVEENPSLQKSN